MSNPGSEKKRITWCRERDVALLTQIISTGIRAFVTSKANTKAMREEEKFNQGDAWTNAEDGILTMLWKHEAFQGVAMPSMQSVINHVCAADGLLRKHAHLYTAGQEQNEPADAGTEGTKDESMSEFDSCIIEVAALYKEAKETEAGKKADKAVEAGDSKEGKRMQAEAVKKRYGSMTEEEYQAGRVGRGKKKKKNAMSGIGAKGTKVLVSEYCAEHESAEEDEILKGKPPKGYMFFDIDSDCDEPYLVAKVDVLGAGAAGVRQKMGDFMETRTENAAKKLQMEEKRQAMERERLEFEKEKFQLEKQKADSEEKKTNALLQALLVLAQRNA